MDLKEIIRGLKDKKIRKNQILILFLSGILLMIIAIPDKGKIKEEEERIMEDIHVSDSTEYVQFLENQLEDILAEMEGAGDVSVMLTLAASAEQVIEKDMDVSEDAVTESDSQGGTRITNQTSRSETTIYNSEEQGIPYVSKEISPKVEGVVVIADGGDNAVVVKNITESIQALFGIESHKIRIVKKGVNLK